MFYYINGVLALKKESVVVIDVNGVGYKINTSLYSISNMPEVGSKTNVYTHVYVREDIMEIYGFCSEEELSIFLYLISVSGVGPKSAISLLSAVTPVQFAMAVLSGDVKTITKAQGIGPKAAQRIILELKDKLKKSSLIENVSMEFTNTQEVNVIAEVISALIVLGYSETDAQKAINGLDTTLSVEELVRQALKNLMK